MPALHLIDAVKRRLHRDIVADPVLHARVLNLYLCGEAYPHAVDDYFPIEHVDCPDLASTMRAHMQDEDKHIALYAKAIEKLGCEVIDLDDSAIFNVVIRSHTPSPWRVEPGMDADARNDRIANFLAHAHFLEKRVAHSLEMHLDACAHSPSPYPGKAVSAVLSDENRHVAYTIDAVHDLVPRQRANDILAEHARAERRANLDFSSRTLLRLLREEADHWPAGRRPFFGAVAWAMRRMIAGA
ncbi:hypothetical protein LF41_315 [Lysobacter dokdonensis DS-58]|uniref:Ferritin-like domain-containing protein n=1 Tax=Lysobacter dokdonensis DS-58 TaxID=1300345 RepID=A0A0A2WJ91_9GAMM|nr:hypothetical protein [Lysobacter dokdonensis]KGQ18782.1 hypothetical protein LF41_315 [Lysobacter dokdonensis DS-58]